VFEVECEFEKLGRVGAEGATLIDILLGLELITQEDLERMNKKEEGEKSSSDGIEFEEERRAVEQVRGAITIVELELQQLPPR
jgi:hypothetical protein